MRKLKKGATLALLTLATTAHAQSSVTLYGTFDIPLLYTTRQQTTANGVTGGGNSVQIGIPGQTQSNWGLQGTEDIGGGRSAVFNLQSYFLPGTGQLLQTDTLFTRAAYVGIKDASIGTLTLGRQTDSYTDALGPFASSNTWATTYGAHFGDVDNLNQAFNFNNAIKFTSASVGGFTLSGIFSLGGVAGSFATNRGYAVSLAYTNGPYSLAAGYLSLNNPLTAALGGINGYIGDMSCSNADALYCELQDSSSLHEFGAGGSVTIGKLTLGGTYTHTQLRGTGFTSPGQPAGSNVNFNIAELNSTYMLAPDLTLGLAYVYNLVSPSGVGSTQFHQINVGATYSLSKRTAIYLVAIGQISRGRGLGTSPTGTPINYAQIPVLNNSPSSRQATLISGIRTSF